MEGKKYQTLSVTGQFICKKDHGCTTALVVLMHIVFQGNPPADEKPALCFPRNRDVETYSASVIKKKKKKSTLI